MLVKHDVDDEINMDKGAHLVDVDAHGVRIQVARMRALIHHALVVRLDRIVRGNAGHNGLGAAAVAREIMVFNIAQANNPVRLCDRGKDVDRRAVLGYAEVCVVLARIKAGKAAEHLLPRRLPHLFRCHFTMDAQGENNGDILIPHTGERQLLCHMRQHGVGRHRAGDIARDDGNFLTGAYDFAEPRRADRVLQRALDLRLAGEGSGRFVWQEHAEEVFVGQVILQGCFIIAKG